MERRPRIRAPNYSHDESKHLCNIIEKHKHVLENKKTDGATLQEKQKTWLKVAEEYNASTTFYHRTVESLQLNYKNIKRKAKKEHSAKKMAIPVHKEVLIDNLICYGDNWEKISEAVGASQDECIYTFNELKKTAIKQERDTKKKILGTGGGPSSVKEDPLMEKVRSLVGPAMDGLYTIYDGDSTLMASQKKPPIEALNLPSTSFCGPPPSPQKETLSPPLPKEKEDLPSTSSFGPPPSPQKETMSPPLTKEKEDPPKDDSSKFTNNRANLKRKPHELLTRKRRLDSHIPEKQSVAEKFKILASEKMEYVEMQRELLKLKILEENEKLVHNRLLRSMEIEDAKKQYIHNEELRKRELEKL